MAKSAISLTLLLGQRDPSCLLSLLDPYLLQTIAHLATVDEEIERAMAYMNAREDTEFPKGGRSVSLCARADGPHDNTWKYYHVVIDGQSDGITRGAREDGIPEPYNNSAAFLNDVRCPVCHTFRYWHE